MSATATCENPKCVCDPCTCTDCGCGVARIGDLERRVIDVLWDQPGHELTGRDVADVLTGYAYTTVTTVLDRLTHKGLVRRRLEGRSIRFAATGTRADHAAFLMHEALGATRDRDATLARFAEIVSRSEATVLRRALDELEGRQRRTR